MRRVIAATLAMLAIGLVATASANADATIYSGYDRVGTVKRSYSGWKVYDTSYSLIGTVRRHMAGLWLYERYSKVGTIRRSYGSRFNVYDFRLLALGIRAACLRQQMERLRGLFEHRLRDGN